MILYVDASAGVSGDMLLSAFFDLGFPPSKLIRLLKDLGLGGVKIRAERILRDRHNPIRIFVGRGAQPTLPRAADQIRRIRGSSLDPLLKESLLRVWVRLAQGEGAAHHRPWRSTVFHQLGHVDTWVDLAGCCAALIHFGVRAVYSSAIPLGNRYQDPRGRWVARPGPATRWLLRRFPTVRLREQFEWTTPTGAAFLSTFASAAAAPPFQVVRLGHGVGHGRPPGGPTALRLLLGYT